MKKQIKKILSIFLATLILLSIVPISSVAADSNTERYTVLVLDTSDIATFLHNNNQDILYTAPSAIEMVKQSALRFLEDVLNASGTNKVAIVSYNETAKTVSSFSTNVNTLKRKINSLTAYGDIRDISAGLEKAESLLSSIPDGENIKKNVVLCTTGFTNHGDYNYTGKYDKSTVGSNWYRINTNIHFYAYANHAIEVAEELKKEATLYSLGLFTTYDDMPQKGKVVVDFLKLTAKDLATSEKYFYEVKDPNDLMFTFGDIAEEIKSDKQELTFSYYTENGDKSAICYYTDKYFKNSSYKYSPSLSTMSLCLAWSAYASDAVNYEDKSENVRDLMEQIGMKNIETNQGFKEKPTADSIGVIAGNKTITVNDETYTLIAVAIRSGNYEAEWASNFTVGTTGHHQGFDEAKQQVITFLNNYINNTNISGNVKIWISGYSRGAATSNLVAAELDNSNPFNNKISYTNDDVYAYCFETPAGANDKNIAKQEIYNNIFNIINPNDPVPYVAPAEWGFCRYGIDKYIITAETASKNYKPSKYSMMSNYARLDSTNEYIVKDDQYYHLSNFVNELSKEVFMSRFFYVHEFQNDFITAIKTLIIPWNNNTIIDDMSLITELVVLIPELLLLHPINSLETILNYKSLGAAHYAELCYSWLTLADENYTAEPIDIFNNGAYRIVRINCPVDVELYDSEGNILASIVDEQAVDVNSSLVYGIDENGQKYIVLPVDGDYDITITAREDAEVNYNITEYCALVGDYTRNINFFDIELDEGQSITGNIPAYTEDEITGYTIDGSTTEYTLTNDDNEPIFPDSDLKGDDSTDAFYTVNVTSEDTSKGTVIGSGYHQYGHFAQVEATAESPYYFAGWYIENNLVSQDSIYRFCVTEDMNLEARFKLNCDHICHETNGIKAFFWKIVKFLYKLFGINPICECGIYHY